RTVPADQAAPEYIRDKVAQTTAERVAEKAEKAAKAEQAAARLAHDAHQGEGQQ
ncbi:MAG: tRNA (adenosine(37)-N6)-threonylcarbamoyltransferase complex dimerization subunit type 1 TsaB, partial [Paraburkholderia sp.]